MFVERPTLMLNQSYEPLQVISWRRAITLLALQKVELLEHYDHWIRSPSCQMPAPSVIRLTRYVRVHPQVVPFNRANIYGRDQYHCQYCGQHKPLAELNYDHVIPRRLGGKTSWENIVTCCQDCNRRKGGRTPGEAGMRLIRPPARPADRTWLLAPLPTPQIPATWKPYVGNRATVATT